MPILPIIPILATFLLIVAPNRVIDGPFTQGKLAVYVIRGPETDSRPYVTLDEGLKSGSVTVRELGSGEVNTLEVANRSDRYLFLHVGDIIRGGKQDRTIATDVLLPPHSEPVPIDAFCVEHGRWTPDPAAAMRFVASDAIASGVSLKRSIQSSRSQPEVWKEVAETEARVAGYLSAPSPSLSASGTYSAIVSNESLQAERDDSVETLLPQVTAHEDALGIVVAIGDEVVGADLYGSHALFQKLARKLIDSYAQESILTADRPYRPGEKTTKIPSKSDVARFLSHGESTRMESISATMERRASANARAEIFEYRRVGEEAPLHASYVKKD